MKKSFYFLFYVLLFFPSYCFASHHTGQVEKPLGQRIDKVIKNFGEDLNIGILVENAKTGKILYRKNDRRYFVPASNEKLFTGFAALYYLGSSFTYQTRLFFDATKIKNGVLDDDVYLQFSGDPSLTFSQLEHLVNALSQAGVKQVKGSIIVDDTIFDRVVISPGTDWEDKDFDFGSPLSAIILDKNCVSAILTPAPKSGQPASMTLPAYPQFISFINHAVTAEATAESCELEAKPENETTYVISGCIKINDSPQTIKMAVHNPRSYLHSVLFYLLNKNKIVIKNSNIIFKGIPTTLKQPLAYEASPPLNEVLATMLKESDNTIANAFFKTIGSNYAHEAGSWKNGSEAVHSILEKSIQLNLPKNMLIDGSGNSRYNHLTAQQIVSLLRKIYLSNNTVFITALPISGVDGTLKERMNTPDLRGKIRAKTGTMSSVSTLSGYVEAQKKRTLIFSILINGFIDPPKKYKVLEDKICAELYRA